MVKALRLRDLDRSKFPIQTREQHLAKIQRWKHAQTNLERVCKEQGITVPLMVSM